MTGVYTETPSRLKSVLPIQHLAHHAAKLFDVKRGNNGSCGGSYLCTGIAGYDAPTGLGTPNGSGAF